MKQIFRHKEREGHEVREDNHRGLSLQSEKSRPELFVRFALLFLRVSEACANFPACRNVGEGGFETCPYISISLCVLCVLCGSPLFFGCGFAALGSLRLNICVTLVAASPH
jgi:hypothetical protein